MVNKSQKLRSFGKKRKFRLHRAIIEIFNCLAVPSRIFRDEKETGSFPWVTFRGCKLATAISVSISHRCQLHPDCITNRVPAPLPSKDIFPSPLVHLTLTLFRSPFLHLNHVSPSSLTVLSSRMAYLRFSRAPRGECALSQLFSTCFVRTRWVPALVVCSA